MYAGFDMIHEKRSFDSLLFKKNCGNGIEPPIFDDDIIHRYNHFLVFLVFFFGSKFHDFILVFFFSIFFLTFATLLHRLYSFPSGPRVYSCYLCLSIQAKIPPNIIQYPFKGKTSCRFWHFNVLPCLATCIKSLFIYSDLPTVMYQI